MTKRYTRLHGPITGIKINISSGNANMSDDAAATIAESLSKIRSQVMSGEGVDGYHQNIWDDNGNVIGTWVYTSTSTD